MINEKKKIEAALFTIGKFITEEELAKICNINSTELVHKLLLEMKNDYAKKETSLELFQQDNSWKLNIKKEFGYITNKLVSDSELDNPTVKTLAIISYKQPIKQSVVVKTRGNMAYQHIKNLREQNFITSEKHGRTRLLKLTKNFYDYFDINEEELEAKLQDPKIKEALAKMFA